MAMLIPILLSSLASALVLKVLLLCFKQNGSILGLFINWFLASLTDIYVPYPVLGALVFGALFVMVMGGGVKSLLFGILAGFLFWGVHQGLNSAMSEILHFFQREFQQRWGHVTNSINVLYSQPGNT